MKRQTAKSNLGALSRIIKATFTPRLLSALVLLFSIQASRAGSATWNLNPTSGDWNTAANWSPATIPNGPNDTATFDVSKVTGISLGFSSTVEVNGIVFDPGASAYTIIPPSNKSPLTISGVGITNNSGSIQNFNAGGFFDSGASTWFTNNATAGSLTAFTNVGGSSDWNAAGTVFSGSSNAGSGTFTNNGDTSGKNSGAYTAFLDTSSAANGTFINNGGALGINTEGHTSFGDTSNAANGTFINNESAGTYLGGSSAGGTARVEVFDFGYLDISGHDAPGVTVGSIEGTGNVYGVANVLTGANNLTVGSNNLSTTFSGMIQDFGAGGSFTKIGTGTLTLDSENTYTGGTTIEGGKLVVNNMTGSATGTGAVQVNAGRLGGSGTIAGAVTIGTGSRAGAVLAPGRSEDKAGTLTIQSALTFNSGATYKCELKTKRSIADKVVANGVTISGAQFSFVSCGNGTLTTGTVFTIIDNTAATPIAGTFSNLADGSTFTAGSNTFQVSYEGGTGNDLTLTVQ